MPLLIISLFSVVLLFVLIYVVFIAKIFVWDVLVVAFLHHHGFPHLFYKGLWLVTRLANTETVIVALVLMMLGSLWCNARKKEVALLTLNVGIAAILEKVIKLQFERLRPQPIVPHLYLSSYSFPSGHAMLSVCFYGFLFYFLSRQFPQARTAITIGAMCLAGLIGVSRFLLGMHYVSDVLGGYLVAIPILCLGIFLHQLKTSGGAESFDGKPS